MTHRPALFFFFRVGTLGRAPALQAGPGINPKPKQFLYVVQKRINNRLFLFLRYRSDTGWQGCGWPGGKERPSPGIPTCCRDEEGPVPVWEGRSLSRLKCNIPEGAPHTIEQHPRAKPRAESGLENNSLPDFFKTAVIKLIPKKGDTSLIKNWRPISLLSNFYKIISRLINSRLQKVNDRLLSRAQKGFTKSRQIHEVIVNCMETMDLCKKYNIKGVLASIDQAKAFDSVSHSYMLKVYDFFRFRK